MKNIEKIEESNNYLKVIKGVIISFLITFIFLFIFSIIMTFSNISGSITFPAIIVINAISILIGSIITIKKIKKKGLINGGLIGTIYIFIVFILSSIIEGKFGIEKNSTIMIITSIISGMLGGIIGINI